MTSNDRVLQYVADANPIPDPRMLDLGSFESVDLTETRRRRVMGTVERDGLSSVPNAKRRRPGWVVALAAAVVVIAASVGSWLLFAGDGTEVAGPAESDQMAAIDTETELFETGDWESWSAFVDPAVYARDTGFGTGEKTWGNYIDTAYNFGYTLISRVCEPVTDLTVECTGSYLDNFWGPAGFSFEDVRTYEFNKSGAIVGITDLWLASRFFDPDLDMNNYENAYLRWLENAYPDLFATLDINAQILHTLPEWVEGSWTQYRPLIQHVEEFLLQSDRYPLEG